MADAVAALAVGAQGPLAPSLRVRTGIPTPDLEARGVHVRRLSLFTQQEYSSFGTASIRSRVALVRRARARLRRAARDVGGEVAWIVRRADMFPGRSLEQSLAEGRRLVYDVDDAIWLDGSDAGGHRLAFLKGARSKTSWLAARADHVIAGNEILAEWLGAYARTVTVVPSLVETRGVPLRVHADGDRLVIGWIGSGTTARYLAQVVGPLERLAKALPDRPIELVTLGGGAPAVRGVRCTERRWTEAAERELLEQMDIGLMPLPANRWTEGKCAYKAIQYMASGVPVVADDVGVVRGVIGAGGVVARSEADWDDGLLELAGSSALRARLGAAGRARAGEHYSVEAWAPTLATILSGR